MLFAHRFASSTSTSVSSSSLFALPLALAAAAFATGCTHSQSARIPSTADLSTMHETTTLTGGEMPARVAEELPPMTQMTQVTDQQGPARRPGAKQGARLAVSNDIVSRCPNLQDMSNTRVPGTAEDAWVAVLGQVAACLNRGELGAANLQVTGSNEGSTAVGYVLTKLGVDLSRVRAVDSFDEDLCSTDRKCAVSTVRVDLVSPETNDDTHI